MFARKYSNAATATPAAPTADAPETFDLTDPPAARPGLGDGFRVYVRLLLWQEDSVLQVPQSALFRHGAGWAVFRLDAGKARLVPVEIGRQVEEATNVDMSVAEKSRGTLDELGHELFELTDKAREHSRHITEVSEQMQRMTQEGMMAMQFEDIVAQMIERISQRTNNVGQYMHAFLSLHRERSNDDPVARYRARSAQLVQLLVESHIKTDALRTHAAKPAKGVEDDVELF